MFERTPPHNEHNIDHVAPLAFPWILNPASRYVGQKSHMGEGSKEGNHLGGFIHKSGDLPAHCAGGILCLAPVTTLVSQNLARAYL